MNSEQTKKAWRSAGISLVLLLLLTLVLYQHTVLYLTGIWNQVDVGEYAHGYLVLAISAYLIVNNRQQLFALVPCPEYRALVGVVAASMLWMIAALVGVEMLQSVGLLFLLLTIVWTMLGNRVIRVLVLPILFIAFAIPIWFPLSPVLQNITADVVFSVIRLLSVPAMRQDNMIMLPAGTLSVEEACSGLRYLLAALTLGTLYAYMNYSSLRSRIIVVLIAAGAAILVNMVRVFIVVYLAYTTEMQHPLVDDHLSLGWYLFGGLVVILLVVDARLNRGGALPESDVVSVIDEASPDVRKKPLRYYLVFVAGVSITVAVAPAVVYKVSHQSFDEMVSSAIDLPGDSDGWSQIDVLSDGWMPVYNGAVNQSLSYKKNNDEVILYVGYYPVQQQGKELINDLNSINNKERWRTVYPRPRIRGADDQQVLEQLLDNGAKKQLLVWYWYNVAGITTTNKYEAKVLQVLGLITGKPWAYVTAVALEQKGDVGSTRQVLEDFILSIKIPMEKDIRRISEHH